MTTWVTADGPGAAAHPARRTRSVAMVGASPNPARASYFVRPTCSPTATSELYFVNPTRRPRSSGRQVLPALAELPEPPDLVDVFRRPDDLPARGRGGHRRRRRSTLWFQLGLRHDGGGRARHGGGLAS